MKIIKSTGYQRDLKRKILNKHKQEEERKIMKIEKLIIENKNLKELLNNPLSKVYGIEKKKNNLDKIYTAKLNRKIRLYIEPKSPNINLELEKIEEVEFVKIDDKHYGEG